MCGATAYFVITINDEQETRLKQIKRAAKAVRFEIKLGRNKIQLEDHTSCLKMNPSRGYAFVVLAALMLSLCIDNSLGAPKRNPFKNVAGKATKLQKKAKVSDIIVDKLPYLLQSIESIDVEEPGALRTRAFKILQ